MPRKLRPLFGGERGIKWLLLLLSSSPPRKVNKRAFFRAQSRRKGGKEGGFVERLWGFSPPPLSNFTPSYKSPIFSCESGGMRGEQAGRILASDRRHLTCAACQWRGFDLRHTSPKTENRRAEEEGRKKTARSARFVGNGSE